MQLHKLDPLGTPSRIAAHIDSSAFVVVDEKEERVVPYLLNCFA